MTSLKRSLSQILVCSCLSLSATQLHALTITVGMDSSFDYNSIQSAIDAAENGDTIQIAAGNYTEGTTTYRGNGTRTGLNFTYRSNLTLIGSGLSTLVDFDNSYHGIMFDASHNISVSNMAFWNSTYSTVTNYNGSSNNSVENAIFGGTFEASRYYANAIEDYYDGVTFTNVELQADFSPVPVPASIIFLASGLLSLLGLKKKTSKS